MNFTVSFSFNIFAILAVTAFAYGSCVLGQIVGALVTTLFMAPHQRSYPMCAVEELIRNRFVKQYVAALVTTIIASQMTSELFAWSAGVMGAVGFIFFVFRFTRRR